MPAFGARQVFGGSGSHRQLAIPVSQLEQRFTGTTSWRGSVQVGGDTIIFMEKPIPRAISRQLLTSIEVSYDGNLWTHPSLLRRAMSLKDNSWAGSKAGASSDRVLWVIAA